MRLLPRILSLLLFSHFSCERPVEVEIQGHRGARGLMPENTVPSFMKALDYGVSTLELDVVITRDRNVLVSHEPWMSATICLDSEGNSISPDSAMKFNIYNFDYSEIAQFDCGSKGNPRFPDQKKMVAHKPLLSEVILAAEEKSVKKPVNYNIEIKSHPEGDGVYHPAPPDFCELVIGEILKYLRPDRFNIQSFDFRILRYMNERYPDITLAVLIENDRTPEENLSELGFLPSIYSCDYQLLGQADIANLHSREIKVIPWTVNEVNDMRRLIDWGVDGLITDYPDRAQKVVGQ